MRQTENRARNRQIALEYEMGVKVKDLARKYGIKQPRITKIVGAQGVKLRHSGPQRRWIYPRAEQLAEEQDLTLEDIAQRTGYSVAYISMLMRGCYKMPRRTAHRIAGAMGWDECEVFGVPDDWPREMPCR